jgi:hypothetical protein
MTTMLIYAEQRTPRLPADLRQHVGERALIELALEAVQAVGQRLPRPQELTGRCSPQMLLTLLTYCYAAGIYGSEDIEWACVTDAAARYICANTAPDQETIQHFRRDTRGWIEACLTCVYQGACGVTTARMSREPLSKRGPMMTQSSAELVNVVQRKLKLAVMIDMAMCE